MAMDNERKGRWLARLLRLDWYVRIGLVILLIAIWVLAGA